jgi:hypothetical protein
MAAEAIERVHQRAFLANISARRQSAHGLSLRR